VKRALGISPHTGWAACVIVGGSLAKPEIVANQIVDMLDDSERFCFHMAEDMNLAAAQAWIARIRAKALANARRVLAPLIAQGVVACAIVAKDAAAEPLEYVLAAHPRIHTAEGRFYRDVLREACPVPVRLVAPASLAISKVGKLAGPPWGRDQKLAALAAWSMVTK
jgi:hypothetical protein